MHSAAGARRPAPHRLRSLTCVVRQMRPIRPSDRVAAMAAAAHRCAVSSGC